MRTPDPHLPTPPARPRYPASIDDEDGTLPPPVDFADDDDDALPVERRAGMGDELAPVVDWPDFDGIAPPLQERRRR